jgi:hypothetical protein
MGVSERVPGYIYMYIYWEDQFINPNQFATKELYAKAFQELFIEMDSRNTDFLAFLKNAGVPQAPYPSDMLETMIGFYKRQTVSAEKLIIHLALDNKHLCIRKGCLEEFSSNDKLLQSISGSGKILQLRVKYT